MSQSDSSESEYQDTTSKTYRTVWGLINDEDRETEDHIFVTPAELIEIQENNLKQSKKERKEEVQLMPIYRVPDYPDSDQGGIRVQPIIDEVENTQQDAQNPPEEELSLGFDKLEMSDASETLAALQAEVQLLRAREAERTRVEEEKAAQADTHETSANNSHRSSTLAERRNYELANVKVKENPVIFYGHQYSKPFDPRTLLSWIRYVNTRIKVLIWARGTAFDAIYALTGGTARDFFGDTFGDREGCTWEEVRAAFVNYYLPIDYGEDVKRKFKFLRQGGDDIIDYNMWSHDLLGRYRDFAVVMESTGDYPASKFAWDMGDIKNCYANGLNKEYRDAIPDYKRKELTMDEIFQRTREKRSDLAILKEIQASGYFINGGNNKGKGSGNGYKGNKNYNNNRGGYHMTPIDSFSVPNNGPVPMELDRMRVDNNKKPRWSDEKFAELKKKKGCFNCGELGHMSFDCPKKADSPR